MRALITGASSGIGKHIALYLNDLGYELYLVSKSKKELDEVFKDIKGTINTIESDLSKEENCISLYEQLKNKNIDILVNNAGFGDAGNFTETNLNKELDMINVNIKAYHILMKKFLKDFTKRGYGRVLNVASMSGFMPGPYMATYYATKSYIIKLSLAIYQELKEMNSNVKISVFCPGPVKTNFTKKAHVHFNISSLSAEAASQIAINGMFKNKLIILPNNMKINYILTKLAPTKLLLGISALTHERASK